MSVISSYLVRPSDFHVDYAFCRRRFRIGYVGKRRRRQRTRHVSDNGDDVCVDRQIGEDVRRIVSPLDDVGGFRPVEGVGGHDSRHTARFVEALGRYVDLEKRGGHMDELRKAHKPTSVTAALWGLKRAFTYVRLAAMTDLFAAGCFCR